MPSYPHPTPNMSLNVVSSPSGANITNLPSPASLVGDVATWMQDNMATGSSWINITLDGAVLVVANSTMDVPYSGMAQAEVLNGAINDAEIKRLHKLWEESNKQFLAAQRSPKLKSADPNFIYAKNELLQMVGLPPALGGSVNAYTDKIGKKIYINGHVDDGSILVHEYIHTFDPGDPSDIGWGFDEGIVDFFARDISARFGYQYKGNGGYEGGYQTIKAIVDEIGIEKICQFWFERSPLIFGPLSEKSRRIAEHCKPGEAASVTPEMLSDFCQTANALTGWKPLPNKSPVLKQSSPAKKWPTVKSSAGVFRSHG